MSNDEELIYRRVAVSIKAEIDAGKITGRLPGERDLAMRYKTSRVTVRKAIAALTEVGIVHCLPRKGAYVGRVLVIDKLPRHRRIGFFLFGDGAISRNESSLLTGLSRRCASAGWHLFFETFADSKELKRRLDGVISSERPDIALVGGSPTLFAAGHIRERGVPVIILSDKINIGLFRDDCDCFYLNWREWGYRAARYFIGRGLTRVSLITGNLREMNNVEIVEGFKLANDENDLPVRRDMITHCRNESIQDGFDAALRTVELNYPDAIITGSNALGAGAALAAAQLADSELVPVMTVGAGEGGDLNICSLEYLDYDMDDAVKRIWRLIKRRIEYPGAKPEVVFPAWNFSNPGNAGL